MKIMQCDLAEMLTANDALAKVADLPADSEVESAIAAFNQSPPKRLSELLFG